MSKKRKQPATYDFSAFDNAVTEPPKKKEGQYDFSAFDKTLKKKDDTKPSKDSSDGLQAISPTARYQSQVRELGDQSQGLIAAYDESLKEFGRLTEQLQDYDFEGSTDPQKYEEFNRMVERYNDLSTSLDNTTDQINLLRDQASTLTEEYREENRNRQAQLFDALNFREEDFEKLSNELGQMTFEDGSKVTIDKLPAEDLAQMITGKPFDEAIQERTIFDRTFGQFGQSVAKVAVSQLPAGVLASLSNIVDDIKGRADVDHIRRGLNLIHQGTGDKVVKPIEDLQVQLFDWAKGVKDWGDQTFELLQSTSEIREPLDVLDFISSALGQGVAQVPAAALTYGASSFSQEIGLTYIEGVERIAEKEGISPEEVIRQGKDEALTAKITGMATGLLEYAGAKGVMGTVKKGVMKDVRKRTLDYYKQLQRSKSIPGIAQRINTAALTEFGTEFAQGTGQQVGVDIMADDPVTIDWQQSLDEGLAGAIGGAGVSTAGNTISTIRELAKNQPQKYQEVLDNVVSFARAQGDTRPDEEIKKFAESIINQKDQPARPKKEIDDTPAPPKKPAPKPKPKPKKKPAIERPEPKRKELFRATGEQFEQVPEGSFRKVEDIPGDVFVVTGPGGNVEIIEGRTGTKLNRIETTDESEALEEFKGRFDEIGEQAFEDIIRKQIKAKGISPRYQEVDTRKKKPRETTGNNLEVQPVPVNELNVDTNRFQNRTTPFSQKTVDSIISSVRDGTFKLSEMDPITIWEDPQQENKPFILAGHSRTEAFRQLQEVGFESLSPEAQSNLRAQGIENFETIPARDATGTYDEAAAIDFATRKSNNLATPETFLDGVKLYRKYRGEGKSNAEIRRLMKNRANITGMELSSHLKEGGMVEQALQAVEDAGTQENVSRVLTIAQFIGGARKVFPQLTDSHENEMYGFLTEGQGKNITKRVDFINRIGNVVNNVAFNPQEPLNLDRAVTRGFNEQRAIDDRDAINRKIKELEKERASKKSPPGPQRLEEIKRELDYLYKDLVSAIENVSKAKEGDRGQIGIFDEPPPVKKVSKPGQQPKRSERVKDDIDKLFDDLDQVLGGSLSSAVNPEAAVIGAKIVAKYIELGTVRLGEIVSDVYKRYGRDGLQKYFDAIKGGYASQLATRDDTSGMTSFDEVRNSNVDQYLNQFEDDASAPTDLEPDSARRGTGEQEVQEPVPDDGEPTGQVPGQREQGTREKVPQQGDLGFSDRIPPDNGIKSNSELSFEKPGPGERIGRGTDDPGSGVVDDTGIQPEPSPTEPATEAPTTRNQPGLSVKEKLELQKAAEGTPTVLKDIDNIRQSLPMLTPEQQNDVLFAENRFYKEQEDLLDLSKGVMFTNGTGTGKTYTGLGIVKRFVNQGIDDILIVTPTDTKVKDWIEDGTNLLLDISQLKDTKDKGKGIVATTYANFRHNQALLERSFKLVVYDESHRLAANLQGDETTAESQHKLITLAPSQLPFKAKENIGYDQRREKLWNRLIKEGEEGARSRPEWYREGLEKLEAQVEKEIDRLREGSAKVVFLSATPFAYHKSLSYADGYLFSIMEDRPNRTSTGYNVPNNYENFFVTNFGYRMRYNKLTMPESGVDVGLMEREFQNRLVKEGALSARKIDVPYDYSREFVLVEDGLGLMIDEGLKVLYNRDEFKHLGELTRRKFNYNYTSQLLEAIKAKKAVERIKKHIELGRKVVLFHSYVNNLPSHPFDFGDPSLMFADDPEGKEIIAEIEKFYSKYPQYRNLDLRTLANPVQTIRSAFGEEAGFYNGTETKKNKAQAVRDFNDDDGKDLIAVQMEAGKEGISLHDISGKHPRAVINLALPIRPPDAIQTEGRGYRIGQQSDAIFEYLVLQTQFEKIAYGMKVKERVKTVENLALGHEARDLEVAFKEGYINYTQSDPSLEQGKGGKESDNQIEQASEYDRAKTYYFARQKKTARRKSAEGIDYYATPEPIGLKLVEWLYPRPNDHHLEPSAGHGAIARFLPEDANNVVIEPSYELRSELAINAVADIKASTFEDYYIGNKFDGIVMNPPYGRSSKTAWEHVEKATRHLRNEGRLIAVVPAGPSFQKRLDQWLETDDSNDYVITAEISLPDVTFERAATKAMTKILVIDKQVKSEVRETLGSTMRLDLSRISDINALFDELETMGIPTRIRTERPTESAYEPREGEEIEELGTVVEGKHTKLGHDIFTVKLNRLVDKDEFNKFRNKADDMGGYYSSYNKGGAVRGFIFNNKENAEAHARFVNGVEDPDTNVPDGDVYDMADSKGRINIGAFEKRAPTHQGTGKPFKIGQKVVELSGKYNPTSTLGQGYTSPRSEGTFYGDTGNIRVKGITDLSAALHELVHALDKNNGVVQNIIDNTADGHPIRERLTDIYEEYYPGASRSHSLRRRLVEGYATFIQKYLESPSEIKKNYQDLINEFINPGGRYYFDGLNEFLSDANKIIAEHQSLEPLDYFSAFVTDETAVDYRNKESRLSRLDRELFDSLSMLENMAKKDGTHWTPDDTSLMMRMTNNAVQVAHKNISNKKHKFYGLDAEGNYVEKLPFNYETIRVRLKKRGDLEEEFGSFLYSRRLFTELGLLREYQDEYEDKSDDAYLYDLMDKHEIDMDQAEIMRDLELEGIQREIDRLQEILRNDQVLDEGFNEEEDVVDRLEAAFDAGGEIFNAEVRMLDRLLLEDIELAHHPNVQLLDDERYDRYKNNPGYAPFKRQIYDELVNSGDDVNAINHPGGTVPSAFLRRRGGKGMVLNPFVGAMMNHAEMTRKAMKQMVYNKLYNVSDQHPKLMQRVAYNPSHEKDPNVVVARNDYKRVSILMDEGLKSVIDENFDFHNIRFIEKLGVAAAKLFRAGTTTLYWQFFAANVLMDQISASVNTRNGFIPGLSSVKHVLPALIRKDSIERQFLNEYILLAGTSQTFLSGGTQDYKKMLDEIKRQKRSNLKKVGDIFDRFVEILAIPGNATEIMTRATEYIMSRKAGKSQMIALEEAGRVSMPFHHMGRLGGKSVGKSFVRSISYFNASLQVMRQTARSLETPDGKRRAAFVMASMLAAGVGSTLYMLDMDEDDPRLQILMSAPPDILSKYLFLPSPNGTSLIKIRVPDQYNVFASLANMFLIESAGKTRYRWSEYGEAATAWLPQQINPFNGMQALFSWVPNLIKPGFEAGVGVKTWPNVRPIESARDRSLPPGQRSNRFSSPLAVTIGEELDKSPKIIDHLIEGYAGRASKYITGKLNPLNFSTIWDREMYLNSSRQVQYYYDQKSKNEQKIKAYYNGLKEYPEEELTKMFQMEQVLVEIDFLLKEYNEIDPEKYPKKANTIRTNIFREIRELEDIDMGVNLDE